MGLAKDTARRRTVAYGLALAMLCGTILTFQLPAQANHGAGCLDLEPETDENTTGTNHVVTATLRSPDTSVPLTPRCPDTDPADNDADNTEPAASSTTIDFEITGPNDPDEGDTPGTPDRFCTIPTGSTSCSMQYRGLRTGEDVIRGWIRGHARDDNEPQDSSDEERPATAGGDEPDTTDVVTKTWVGGTATTLDCTPETETNSAGDAHTVTCTATNQNGGFVEGQQVDAEATGANDPDNGDSTGSPDFTCETNEEGQCSFTHGPGGRGQTNQEGTTTYRAWIDSDGNHEASPQTHGSFEGDASETRDDNDSDTTDVVDKQWRAAPLNCEPETDRNPANTSHTITCTARDVNGEPQSGVLIDVEASGASDPDAGSSNNSLLPDFTCTTGADGSCSVTHGPEGRGNSNQAGTTTYRAWIDQDGDHSASANPDEQTHGAYEADPREGQDDSTTPGDNPEPDQTDVVTKLWTASRLDCNPETARNPSGAAHVITCRAADENQTAQSGVEVDIEAAGANDPDGSGSLQTPDFTCVTGGNGICTITHGPGGVGSTSGSGQTIYTGWIDFDSSNATVEADPNEGRTEGATREPDNTDVIEKTWIGSRLDCNPETDTNPAESAHTVTCTATDTAGTPVSGMNVDVEATGANDPDNANSPTSPDFTCTTGTDGNCSLVHGPGGRGTTNAFGRTIYLAWIDADNDDATTEADTTESRDETGATPSATPGATASPSPTPTRTSSPSPSGSPSGSPTPSGSPSQASSAAGARSSGHALAQQTGSPSPTPTASPSPSFTPGGPAGGTAEPDNTDVVEKNWSAVPDRLQIDPESDSAPVGSCNTFTITAFDAEGNPVQGVVVDVEQRHERSDNATANDEPDISFCTPSETDGSNPSGVDATRGDLGDGRDGTVGGEAVDTTDESGKVTIGVRVSPQSGSNGTGNVLVTAFYENEDNDDPDTDDPQDSATKTWTPSRARTIDCEPETARNDLNTEHTVTCTVRDTNGQPAPGEGVTFTEDGPGRFTTQTDRTTNAEGRVSATVTSDEAGTQSITGTLTAANEGEPDSDECERPANDPEGAPAGQCSDSVEKTWRRGARVQSGPCKNFFQGTRRDRSGGGQVIVGTNGADTLVGTGEDDIICGLGGKDIIRGRGGNDVLDGGGRNDTVTGGRGGDRVLGRGGFDTLKGNAGRDRLSGHAGDDLIAGNNGRDTLRGGRGDDRLNGGPGRDNCGGGAGTDRLRRCE